MPVFYVTDNYGEGRSGPALLDLVEPPELLPPQSAPGRLMRSGWAGAGWWGRGRYTLRVRRGHVARQLVPVMGSRRRMGTTCLLKKPARLRWAPSMLSFGGGEEEAWLSFQGPMEALSGLLGGICPWIHSSIFILLLPVELVLSPLSSSLLSSLSPIASV